MRIFLSHSSRHRDLAERLRLSLEADARHDVFLDRRELRPGEPFDATLREGIARCELFVFLVSPESIAPSSYARAELSLAEAQWRHPGGRVLPVLAAPTPLADIPAYLRAVTILEPRGDLVAETVAAVDALQGRRRRPSLRRLGIVASIVALAAAGVAGWQALQVRERDREQAAAALSSARSLCETGDHAIAWQRLSAIAADPQSKAAGNVRAMREDCGMRWLRDISFTDENDRFIDVVDHVVPVLAEGAASAHGQRAADLLAHRGWAEFLLRRARVPKRNPASWYAKALAEDAGNVYAHAMWGREMVAIGGSLEEARRHFDAALAAGRDRAFVREAQLTAMAYSAERAADAEALRVVIAMHAGNEPISARMREDLWSRIYTNTILRHQVSNEVLEALRDPASPAAFLWLFPEADVKADDRPSWNLMLASLEEGVGNLDSARARYASVQSALGSADRRGSIGEAALAGLQRLSAKP